MIRDCFHGRWATTELWHSTLYWIFLSVWEVWFLLFSIFVRFFLGRISRIGEGSALEIFLLQSKVTQLTTDYLVDIYLIWLYWIGSWDSLRRWIDIWGEECGGEWKEGEGKEKEKEKRDREMKRVIEGCMVYFRDKESSWSCLSKATETKTKIIERRYPDLLSIYLCPEGMR